ncbi:MAG: hypothetical protein WCG78_00455 [Candidatus Omnitrophota bacterium]
MIKRTEKIVCLLISILLIVQLTGCGTLMYPERKGQRSGRIDAGVAILDGVGLLLFIIPGVIAYAVDFSNGTIYLPGGPRLSMNLNDVKQVKFDLRHGDNATIEKIIKKETGCAVDLNRDNIKVSKLGSTDEMMKRFAEVVPGMHNRRVALNR